MLSRFEESLLTRIMTWLMQVITYYYSRSMNLRPLEQEDYPVENQIYSRYHARVRVHR
jgi:hypothetical protein